MAEAIIVVAVALVGCFAWFSEKPCLLFIATSEESFSIALISDLLPAGFVIVGCDGVVAVGVAVDVVVVAVGVVGVCARLPALLLMLLLLWLVSLSSALSASLSSCWYISSTMGFHKRTLAFMNQFDT